MRGIKFRVWNTQMMEYLDEWGMDKIGWLQRASNRGLGYTLMQYTGLKDKNGVEIYEGDLWQDDEGVIGQVKDSNYGWIVTDLDALYDCLAYGHVVGNVHENPELLNEE